MKNTAYNDLRKLMLTYMLIIDLDDVMIIENDKEFIIHFDEDVAEQKEQFICSFYNEMKLKYSDKWIKPIKIVLQYPENLDPKTLVSFDEI